MAQSLTLYYMDIGTEGATGSNEAEDRESVVLPREHAEPGMDVINQGEVVESKLAMMVFL